MLRHLHIVLPDMAHHRFLAPGAFGTYPSGRTAFAKISPAFVFPVALPVCGGIMQRTVLRADHIIKVLVIHIHPPGMAVLFGLGTGIASGKNVAAPEDPFANPRRFVGAVRHHGFVLGVVSAHFIIQRIKGYAVVDIAGSDVNTKNKIVLVAGRVRLVGKALFVFPLVEHAAFRVGGGYHRFLRLLLLGRIFVAVVGKGLLAVFFPVSVYLSKQLFCVPLRLFGNRLFGLLFQIGTCLNMGSIHKNRFCVQIPFLCRRFQHPAEYILHRAMVEPVLEVVAHRGKMRHCLIQRISNEPPVCQVHAHFFQSSAERRNPIDMLDQNNFEQYHRVYAWTAVVLAVQILYKFVDLLEINGCVDLPQQVILRHHVFQTYKFQLSSVFCVLYQHFYHPTPLYRIPFPYTRKRPPIGGLFRQAEL